MKWERLYEERAIQLELQKIMESIQPLHCLSEAATCIDGLSVLITKCWAERHTKCADIISELQFLCLFGPIVSPKLIIYTLQRSELSAHFARFPILCNFYVKEKWETAPWKMVNFLELLEKIFPESLAQQSFDHPIDFLLCQYWSFKSTAWQFQGFCTEDHRLCLAYAWISILHFVKEPLVFDKLNTKIVLVSWLPSYMLTAFFSLDFSVLPFTISCWCVQAPCIWIHQLQDSIFIKWRSTKFLLGWCSNAATL